MVANAIACTDHTDYAKCPACAEEHLIDSWGSLASFEGR